jgi:hypothetical protein
MKRLITTAIFLAVCLAQAATTIDSAHPYAYGANTGWINARANGTNGTVIGRYFCSGYLYSANTGWISLGAGVPTNGYAYGNQTASDFGVNHDEAGSLRGYAYSANTGWIAFENQGNPRVDLRTGNLSGYAYGANTGWISLSNAQAFVRTERLDSGPDSDADGLPDAWERSRFGNLTALSGSGDWDHDGVSDGNEYSADTDPIDDASHLYLTLVEAGGSTNRLAWPSRNTRLYQAQSTVSLTGLWTSAGGQLAGTGGELALTDVPATNSPARFYRVNAILPLD